MRITDQKKQLRKQFMERRKVLPPDAHRAKSRAIVKRLLQLPEIRGADIVHMYWPMVDRGEIDLRMLWKQLREMGKQVALPVMARAYPPRLRHVLLESVEALRPNRWGVWEPGDGIEISPERMDAIIAPALAIDRSGYRLGYGGGYYDAFLAEIRAPIVGAVFSEFLVNHLPHETHDIPVDIIVTDRETIRLHHRKAEREDIP